MWQRGERVLEFGRGSNMAKTRIERHTRPTKGRRGVIRDVKDVSGKLLRGDPGKSNNKISVLMWYLVGPSALRYKTSALDALNQYNLPALALSASPKAIHFEKHYITGKYYCWDAVSHQTNTEEEQPSIVWRNRFANHQEKTVINTETPRINGSLYCGSFLSLMQSILIRDVNYPCNSRQIISFVFSLPPRTQVIRCKPQPIHSQGSPSFYFSLPKGLINCRVHVFRAGG